MNNVTRRNFGKLVAGGALLGTRMARAADDAPVIERALPGRPFAGKVMAAIQAHSDDVPLSSAGTVAKLVHEGYTGYLIRVTNDDMGDAPGLGLAGTIGENVLRNEQDNNDVARALGLKKVFNLNYNNHRMSVANWPELESRLIFLIRLLKVDTVVTWDPWGDFEENPDHWVTARCVEAACWMAGRAHDYPEQFEAGLRPHAVTTKYYFARAGGQRSNRVVDISDVVDRKVEANRANRAKGPAGGHGAQLRADLRKRGLSLPLLGGDDLTADRQYIKEFVLRGDRERGKKYGVAYAEQFRYVGGGEHGDRIDDYVKQFARPVSQR